MQKKLKQKVVKDSIKCVTINLPNGTRYITDAKKLPSWADLGYPGHSGFIEYEIEFEWKGKRAFVDFGKVRHCLVFSLDKRVHPFEEGEKISFAPFKADLGKIEEGRHILYVYVQNTVVNRYIGTKDMEKMFDIPQRIDSDRKMLMSGLFGEIQLFEEEDLVVKNKDSTCRYCIVDCTLVHATYRIYQRRQWNRQLSETFDPPDLFFSVEGFKRTLLKLFPDMYAVKGQYILHIGRQRAYMERGLYDSNKRRQIPGKLYTESNGDL